MGAAKLRTKPLKLGPENDFVGAALRYGYVASKRGWPDFICYGEDDTICVEVKRTGRCHLSAQQWRVMQFLADHGIRCFLWNPKTGFTKIQRTVDKPLLFKANIPQKERESTQRERKTLP